MKNNTFRPNSRQEGFTLVELLIVIAIIAVLSAIAIVNLNSARNKGNDAAVRANLIALYSAVEIFYDDNNNSYVGFCNATSIQGIVASLDRINNYDCSNLPNPKACFDCDTDTDEWIVFGRLHDGRWLCVDWHGRQSVTSTPNSGVCF